MWTQISHGDSQKAHIQEYMDFDFIVCGILLEMDPARSFKVKPTTNYKILMLSQVGHNGEKHEIAKF